MVEGEPFAATPEAGPDLVGDQDHAVGPASCPEAGQECAGRHDHAARSLDRLDDQPGRQVIGLRQLRETRIQGRQAGLDVVHRTHRIRGMGIGQEVDDPVEGGKGGPDPRAVRDRQRTERTAMIPPGEGEEPAAARRVLRGLERRFDGLGARIGQLEAVEARGQDRGQTLVQIGPERRRQTCARMNDSGIESPLHGRAMRRMAVSQVGGRRAAHQVEPAFARRRPEPGSLPGREDRRRAGGAKGVRGRAFMLPGDCEHRAAGARHVSPRSSRRNGISAPSAHCTAISSPGAGNRGGASRRLSSASSPRPSAARRPIT